MSAEPVYHDIRTILEVQLAATVPASTLERLALLVVGMIEAEHAAPARVARALDQLGLSHATVESIERRIRRIENEAALSAVSCRHPLAAHYLRLGQPQQLLLILDPTTQQNHVVLLTVAVWYRGSALPLAWLVWPANQPLTDERFWARVAVLLEQVAPLLPLNTQVIWLADRAFGTPAFTDLLAAYGWHYVVRVQAQTRTIPQHGREQSMTQAVYQPGARRKFRGQVFKKRGWRAATVVLWWGRACAEPLYLVSDLPPRWQLVHLYRQRYGIEALFRQYKRGGWRWEHGQVRDREHLGRLLVGMALATWLAVLRGVAYAHERLAARPSGRRRTRPYAGKYSLFRHGLHALRCALQQGQPAAFPLSFDQWEAPAWVRQITYHDARAFVFAASHFVDS